jgi:hypothetical protein
MRFIIWSPNFVKNCAGIRALHSLAWELKIRGNQVELFNATTIDPEKPISFFNGNVQDSDIGIYPEIQAGNPIRTSKNVRWLLANVGNYWAESRKNDRIYNWGDWGNYPRLYTPMIDVRFFNDLRGKKERSGVLTYKENRINGDTEVTDNWPENWDKLSDLFRSSEYMRCGDNNTALMIEARLCGCPVLMTRPDDTVTYVGGKVGVANSLDELQAAKDNIHEMWGVYHEYVNQGYVTIENFITQCKEW